ncbi:alpha-L-fucosidase [Occallatibacter riparius]|uniref:alpha-L-fucosidase n=1 Tax=Occallatibacter riparius TaxID=1002689 RepID=A0A9J7BPE0_9BACT|nr:alpha-L-fucosidase [Occallatibacter riparius]UWZ84479.1 alpha-L-fucosidase [Occallatibacter riparius]
MTAKAPFRFSIFLLAFALVAANICAQDSAGDIRPAPYQTAWQDLEFGVIIHFSTNTFLDREWGDGTAAPSTFNPTAFDPDQWMKAIHDSGAKYVVLVAKHHDGFCLWPTQQTSYSVKNSPWRDGKGDVVGEVAKAARKYGLKFGVYLSPWDRHDPRYKDSAAYDRYYNDELSELASNYGDLVEFWLDGAGSEGHVYDFKKIIETLRTYQPNTIVFADTGLFEYGDARWVGNEAGVVSYENWNVIDRHGYRRWRPVESDTPLRKLHWFWHPNDESSLKSLPELLDTYDKTVGRGAQLMLGLAPDNRGLLPENDVARLKEFGEALQKRAQGNLALHHGAGGDNVSAASDGNPDTFWSAPEGSHHAVLELSFDHPITFDHALTMEWLNDGQHVQKYAIEVWNDKQRAWTPVASGEAIGHKKIDAFTAVTASRVRLNILSSTSEAHIREFQLFNWSAVQ